MFGDEQHRISIALYLVDGHIMNIRVVLENKNITTKLTRYHQELNDVMQDPEPMTHCSFENILHC